MFDAPRMSIRDQLHDPASEAPFEMRGRLLALRVILLQQHRKAQLDQNYGPGGETMLLVFSSTGRGFSVRVVFDACRP